MHAVALPHSASPVQSPSVLAVHPIQSMPVLLPRHIIARHGVVMTDRRSIRALVSRTTLRLDVGSDIYQGSEKVEERPFTLTIVDRASISRAMLTFSHHAFSLQHCQPENPGGPPTRGIELAKTSVRAPHRLAFARSCPIPQVGCARH